MISIRASSRPPLLDLLREDAAGEDRGPAEPAEDAEAAGEGRGDGIGGVGAAALLLLRFLLLRLRRGRGQFF